ncbi:MAG: ABC transporter permease [Bacteroidaceae bacterium]|nr:ABC transporter permease [Bacteroidaceae bacterium]
MLDTFQEIYGAIMRNKMRTIATGFAVASGLFLIIVLQGAGNGVINSFEANMGNFSFDAIHIFGGMTTKPFEGIKEGRFIQLDSRDVEMTERVFPNYVKDVMPSLEKSGLIASFGQQHISAELMGVRPSWAALDAVKILQGRFINEIDLQQKRKVVVISDSNAKDLFPKEREVIGKALDLSGISYTVVGIYKDEQMSNERTFYAPFTTIAAIYNYGRFINRLSMTIHHIESDTVMEQFMDEYTRAASHIHSFAPDDKRALWIWNQAGDSIQMKKAQNILHTAFWILGLLTLVSGVVGVSNIMLISVKERTREFGIRRAIGARPWSIIRMVMAESVVITAIFGYIGMLLGVFFCEWMDNTVGNQTMDVGVFQAKYFVDPTVNISTCLIATVIIVVAGALAGFFPARKAVKVKPIDALRG